MSSCASSLSRCWSRRRRRSMLSSPASPVARHAFVVAIERGPGTVFEGEVNLTAGKVESWVERPGVQPHPVFEEFVDADEVIRADERWREALRRRGVTDFDQVQIDPWPAGNFGHPEEQGPAHSAGHQLRARRACVERLRPPDRGGGGGRRSQRAPRDPANRRGRRAGAGGGPALRRGGAAAAAGGPAAAGDHAAAGDELHARRPRAGVAEMAHARLAASRARGWCCSGWAYADGRRAALDLLPHGAVGDGGALRRDVGGAVLQERLR